MIHGIGRSAAIRLPAYAAKPSANFETLSSDLIKASPTEREQALKTVADTNPGLASRLRQFLAAPGSQVPTGTRLADIKDQPGTNLVPAPSPATPPAVPDPASAVPTRLADLRDQVGPILDAVIPRNPAPPDTTAAPTPDAPTEPLGQPPHSILFEPDPRTAPVLGTQAPPAGQVEAFDEAGSAPSPVWQPSLAAFRQNQSF